MPKVVDVILRGQLKASYPVSFAMLNSPTTEQDFIGYAALGFAYFEAVVSGWSEFRADDLERAETFAKKALALDPATTRAYHVLSQVYRLMRSMNSSSVGSLASKTTGYEATKRSCTKTSTVFFILTALSFYWSRRSARDCVSVHDSATATPELPKASKEERSMTSVFFVTHPEVVVDPLIPVPQWKLSPRGIGRVRRMLEQAWVADIGHIVTSEERKALDTAELLAAHLALSYDTRAELGENDRSATGYLPREEFEATADLFFKHPDRSAKGWEPARAAHARIVGAIDGILEAAPPVNMAVIAHGAVGALLLCHLKGVPISRAEDQPGEGGGNFFVFRRDDRALLQGWRPIDVTPTRIV